MVNVATKAKEVEEVEESYVEVELPEDTFTLETLLNTRDCVMLQEYIYLNKVKSYQMIKWRLHGRS